MGSELPALPTLAARVAWLFDTASSRLGRTISKRGAAREIKAAGTDISHTTLLEIMSGRKTNPTMERLTGIAEFFGVPVGWLAGENVDEELPDSDEGRKRARLQAALRDARVQNIAERSVGLSSLSLDAIAQIIEAARIAEGLEAGGQDAP